MRFIMCQPATKRFEWELEVSLTRLKKLGVNNIILLFTQYDDSIPKRLQAKYDIEVHVYEDKRVDKSYIPSVKPYLWAKFLQEDRSRENDTYFYMDSDVIFRELPEIGQNDNIWYGSDCSGYLGNDYIDSKSAGLLESMCELINVDPKLIRSNNPVCGAQWVITKPTFEYWLKVYEDSTKLYRYLDSLPDCDIQKWTAEMWAQLWNVYHFGKITEVSEELNFSWATDSVERYYKTKLYHNAGVIEPDMYNLFFKGEYIHKTPFDVDLSYVDETRASIKYVEAIREVRI